MKLITINGFSLNYEAINASFDKYQTRFLEVLKLMLNLEAGEKANKTEDRMVGHYWLRNPKIAPNSSICDAILSEQKKIQTFFRECDYENLFYVGIGGSGLGPALIFDCFKHRTSKKVIIFDNVDPEGVAINLSGQNLSRTLVCVTSKSGTTTETLVVKDFLKSAFQKQGLVFENHAVAITMEETPLWKEASSWLTRFKIWDWVGGRTSIFSAVGLSVLCFLGLNDTAFLEGAAFMDTQTRLNNLFNNPAAIIAYALVYCHELGKKNLCILPYSDRLQLFSKYLQQLFMESLGKTRQDGEKFGVTVYGNKGTTDQHSFVQQLRQGIDDFLAIFIRRLEPEISIDNSCLQYEMDRYLDAFFLGTRKALSEAKREHVTLTVPCIDEYWLGSLIALFERVVGFYAFHFDINAYDQPGVEAGKKAAKEFLENKTNLKEIL